MSEARLDFGLNKLAQLAYEQKLEDGSQILPLDPEYPYYFRNFLVRYFGAELSLPDGPHSD